MNAKVNDKRQNPDDGNKQIYRQIGLRLKEAYAETVEEPLPRWLLEPIACLCAAQADEGAER